MAGYRLISEARDELVAGVSSALKLEIAGVAEAPAAGFEVRPAVRRRIVRRFPYSILYTLEGDEVVVLAVAHQSRRPGYWTRRV